MLRLVLFAHFGQHGAQIAQGAPAFGVGVDRVNRRGDIAAVAFFREKPIRAGAIFVEPTRLFFPTWLQLFDGRSIASLPIVAGQVQKFEAGLVKLKAFARKIEQRDHQAAHVFFVAPNHHGEGGVAAFGFI